MQISVIGSGYVGLVAACCFAELGHQVVCADIDAEKIAALNHGRPPIYEDFLQELLARHRGHGLRFATSVEDAVRDSTVIFIAVGTPKGGNGAADLSCVESVTKSIALAAQGYKVVVEKSTVPVYTSERIQGAILLHGRRRDQFDVVSNPEFLREGTAVTDFLYPDRIVVGAGTEHAARIMREVYQPLLDGSYAQRTGAVPKPERARALPTYIETSPHSAELIKHASNAFLALKISFINAVANVCEAVGADVEEVALGVGSDSRIGPDFLRPGIGYGGSCFPKDVAAFRALAHEFGYEFRLLDEVNAINDERRLRFLKRLQDIVGELKGKRLGVLGLAFKDGTDDVRESPAIHIIASLLEAGCRVSAFDPAAMERARQVLGDAIEFAADPYAAAQDADALLILTEWKEFAALDLARLRQALRHPVVLDGRNLFKGPEMVEAGLDYHAMGRAALPAPRSVLKKSRSS
jgi:UDPglucose 6-dehydrogenase